MRDEPLPPKLFPSVRQLASTAASLVQTRVALASVELQEELQRVIWAAAYGAGALVLAFVAFVVATFAVVAAVSPDNRVMTMIIIVVVYVAIAAFLAFRVKALFANRPPFLSATLAELKKDQETLSQMARAHEEAEEARVAEARSTRGVR